MQKNQRHTEDSTAQARPLGTVAIVGYGSQGRAHALNLRDSGVDVVIGARPGGGGAAQAGADGFEPVEVEVAVRRADLTAVLVPDTAAPALFEESIAPALRQGSTVLFAHGFNIHYARVRIPDGVDCVMVAPKAPGALVRRQYEQGSGVPCLFAVHQDASGSARQRVLRYAAGIGGMRAAVLETTFGEEAETDLFGEQAVLCGGVTELVVAGFETLTAAGYNPDVAYYECMHELKLIVDLLYEGGLARMHRFVSDTAKYGDLTRGPRVVDGSVRKRMAEILEDIRSGGFAREWVREDAEGRPTYNALLKRDLEHPIETVGRRLRADMPWLTADEATTAAPREAVFREPTTAGAAEG